MLTRPIIAAALLFSLPAMLPVESTARAQVTVDPRALDPLKPASQSDVPAMPTRPPATTAHPTPKANAAKPAESKNQRSSSQTAGTANKPAPGNAPSVPAAAPPGPSLPPPIVVPTRAPAATPVPTVTPTAPGEITKLQGGLRLTFGPGRADLNPETEAAIRALVHGDANTPPAAETTSFTVTTYAAGTPDDPSTARRLSQARALAVRSVLIGQGIASPRIYPKAYGPNQQGFADGPPDRADITIATNPVPIVTAKPR